MNQAGFRRLDGSGASVTMTVDGQTVTADTRDTVAGALLAAGIDTWRRNVPSGQPRGPFCMMGVCFECVLTVDGVPERRACMVPVRDGMTIRTGRRDTTP